LTPAVLFLRTREERARVEADGERRLLATAIEQAGESVVITDTSGAILYANPAFTRACGYSREEVLGKNPRLVKSGRHDPAFYEELWRTLSRGEPWSGHLVNRRKDGTLFEEDARITPVRGADGRTTHYIAVKRDMTSMKTLEEQLYHSQKMEAIGRLAGGVAHDFNNILTTINGYAEMLTDSAPADSQLAADLAEILGAGRRAALLTRQLLAFSRRAPSETAVVDLRVMVRSLQKMLRRTIGEDIALTIDLPEHPLWVDADPSLLDQVLMNLAVNARDAMPRGGALRVVAREVVLESDEPRLPEVVPAGRYAALSVADDGVGMEAATLERVFEPFFTTKEKGKGTGLGLATVFGIVKQHHGAITVDSAPGRGTVFTVYLPLAAAPAAEPASAGRDPEPAPRGDETVLVVEDQDNLLNLVVRALTAHGYQILAARGGEDALAKAAAFPAPIHLLLTDVVMPGLRGDELARELRSLRPETRVLFMSGYTDGRLDALEGEERVDLLLKPFAPEELCRRVRAALDA
jgi:PAS domain S-box-containing protein